MGRPRSGYIPKRHAGLLGEAGNGALAVNHSKTNRRVRGAGIGAGGEAGGGAEENGALLDGAGANVGKARKEGRWKGYGAGRGGVGRASKAFLADVGALEGREGARCLAEKYPVYAHFYDVLKDRQSNLEFRRALIAYGNMGAAERRAIWHLCAADGLFFVNVFCWTYDPRVTDCPAIPFITYAFQDVALDKMFTACGKEDVFVEKSRDMGASWMLVLVFFFRWLFAPMQSFLLVSRNESYVDNPGNPKSLFWKLDFLLAHLPGWVRPGYVRTKCHLHNQHNGSVIDGESTTGDVGRGDRRTAIALDEFAAFETSDGHRAWKSSQHTTNSRFVNSTPQGTANAHYEVGQTDILKVRLHWSQHPEKNVGLYGTENGMLKIYDRDYEFPVGYEHILDGKLRSPWYDGECRRATHPQEIAQELDIDYGGSNYSFFPKDLLGALMDNVEGVVRPPYMVGNITRVRVETGGRVEYRVGTFKEDDDGSFLLWTNLDERGWPPEGDYAIGVDVALGTGASNSAISVVNRRSGEKVLEYASPFVDGAELAEIVICLARWFSDAFLIWDAGGEGRVFGNRLIRYGYDNFYFKRNEADRWKKESTTPGYWCTRDNKRELLAQYRQALRDGTFVNRSRFALEECKHYIYSPSNKSVEHDKASTTIDPTGAADNHGDRVIADALACFASGLNKKIEETEKIEEIPVGSYAWRTQIYEAEKAEGDSW